METCLKRNIYIFIFLVLLAQAVSIVRGNYLLSMLILAIFIFAYMLQAKKTILVFLILFARVFFDSMPTITAPKSAFGLSFMELYTVGLMIFMVIYLLTYRSIELDPISKGTVLILFSLILTGAYHGNIRDLIDISSVWLYFLITYSFIKYISQDIPLERCFKIIGLLSLYPCLNQLYSIGKGVGEMHLGFIRYAGTYIHPLVIGEYLFFAIPAILYLLSKENRPKIKFIYIAIIILYHAGILMAGYRTIWLATTLFWFLYVLFISQKKILSVLLVLFGGIIIWSFAGKMLAANLGQIETMVDNWDAVTSLHTHTYDRLLSGRIGTWKGILRTYVDSGFIEKVLGFGSNSIFNITFRNVGATVYAHNEYISALCETGILGLLCLLIWMFTINYEISKYRHCVDRQHVQITQSIILSLLIIAFGTMPFRHLSVINYLAVYLAILPQCTAMDSEVKLKGSKYVSP